jgi:hypothetical protein
MMIPRIYTAQAHEVFVRDSKVITKGAQVFFD